ncbi:MAG TPA: response regulator [Opitutaceae bacterium]|jgi:DNA-binding NtrC family response regulator|nr:response regulator [Opitutaceae bacterium]
MANILLLDDNVTFLKLQGEYLRCAGHQVTALADSRKVVRTAQGDPFDIIITDVIMPDRDGIEVIMELHRKMPALKIIAMSGGGRVDARDYLDMARKLGASQTLAKPFSGEQMLQVINSTLQGAA